MYGGGRVGTGHGMGPVPRPIGVSWVPCVLVRASVCARGCMGVRVRVCLCVCVGRLGGVDCVAHYICACIAAAVSLTPLPFAALALLPSPVVSFPTTFILLITFSMLHRLRRPSRCCCRPSCRPW